MRLVLLALICIYPAFAGYVRNETVDQLLEDLLKPDSTDYKNDTCGYHKLAWVLNPYHGLSYRRLLLIGLMGKVCPYTARMPGVCSRTLADLTVGKFIEIDAAVRYWKTLCINTNRVKRKIYTWASKLRKSVTQQEEHRKVPKPWQTNLIWPVLQVTCDECLQGMNQFYTLVHRKEYEDKIVNALDMSFCEYVDHYRDVCNRISKALVTEVRKHLEDWLVVRSTPLKACLREGFCHADSMTDSKSP